MEGKLSVGEIAKRTGLTTRALQHYDNIGLLKASCRVNGRRYYSEDALLKLEQIQFYKLLGFPLDEIKEKLLTNPTIPELKQKFEEHISMVVGKIEQLYTLLDSLQVSMTVMELGKYPPPGLLADLIQSLNGASFIEWTPDLFFEQDRRLYEKYGDGPEEAFRQYRNWKAMSIEAATLKELGIAPNGETAQKLAKRFWEFILETTEGHADQYLMFENFIGKRDQWATGEAKLMDASIDYLGRALEQYIRNNNIEVPAFLEL